MMTVEELMAYQEELMAYQVDTEICISCLHALISDETQCRFIFEEFREFWE